VQLELLEAELLFDTNYTSVAVKGSDASDCTSRASALLSGVRICRAASTFIQAAPLVLARLKTTVFGCVRETRTCPKASDINPTFDGGKPSFFEEDRLLVRHYLAGAERGGTDVRLDLGIPFRIRAWPRTSIPPSSWKWQVALAYHWKCGIGNHINALELSAVHNSLRWLTRTLSFRSVRFLHLVDSQVCAGVLSEGRTNSKALQLPLCQICALCLAADLYGCYGYINTCLNPADYPSRLPWRPSRSQMFALAGRARI
jgi:hypothetical protein